jgi:uncharacterized protein
MSFSLFDVSVPVFRQYLSGLSGVLAKAEAQGLDEAELMGFRLYEDMQPFTFQVMQSIAHAAGAVATLRGETYPRAADLTSLAACKAAVDAAVAYLDGVKSGDITVDADADVRMQTPRGTMVFVARDYLFTFAYGNFFFHVNTARACRWASATSWAAPRSRRWSRRRPKAPSPARGVWGWGLFEIDRGGRGGADSAVACKPAPRGRGATSVDLQATSATATSSGSPWAMRETSASRAAGEIGLATAPLMPQSW